MANGSGDGGEWTAKEIRDQDKELHRLKESFDDLDKNAKELASTLEDLQETQKSFATQALSISEKLLVSSVERKEIALEELGDRKNLIDAEQVLLDKEKEKLDNQIQQTANQHEQRLGWKAAKELAKAMHAEQAAELDGQQKKLKKKTEELSKQAKSIQAQANVAQQSTKAFSSIASSMGIANSETSGMVRGMGVAWIQAVKTDGIFKGTLKTIGSMAMAFWDVFSPVSLISSLMSKIWTASLEFMEVMSEALASFSAVAGDAGEMAGSVAGAMSLGTGVNITQAAQAAGALAGAWQGMADATDATRSSMIRMAAEFERVGWSAAESGKSLNFMTKALGMTAGEAKNEMQGLASAALDLGMTPTELGSNLAQFQGDLALYGGRIGDKFIEIAAAAKAAGLEFADVIALGQKFDTFEGAASTVGELNAYLGGPMLNSLELFQLQAEKGPAAVQEAVVSALKASGKTFQTMSSQEQRAFAKTLDMKVDAFGALMGYRSEEMIATEKAAKKEAAQQTRYRKMLSATIGMAEKIKNFFQTVFAVPEVVEALQRLFGQLYGSESRKGLSAVTALIGKGMAFAINLATTLLKKLTEQWNKRFVPLLKKIGKQIGVLGDDFSGTGKGMEGVADSILDALEWVFKGVGDIILVFQGKMSFWDTAIGDFIQDIGIAISGFMIVMMGVSWMLPGILGGIGTALNVFGASIMTGVGFVGLLAVESLVGMIAIGFLAWGSAMDAHARKTKAQGKLLATMKSLILGDDEGNEKMKKGFGFWKAGMEMFTEAVGILPFEKMLWFTAFLKDVQVGTDRAALFVDMLADSVNNLSVALAGLPGDKLGTMTWNVTRVLLATSKVDKGSADSAVRVIEKAKEYQQEVVKNKDNVDAIVELIKATGATAGGGATGGGGMAPINITLELGGTVLDKYIWDSVNYTLMKKTG